MPLFQSWADPFGEVAELDGFRKGQRIVFRDVQGYRSGKIDYIGDQGVIHYQMADGEKGWLTPKELGNRIAGGLGAPKDAVAIVQSGLDDLQRAGKIDRSADSRSTTLTNKILPSAVAFLKPVSDSSTARSAAHAHGAE